ncbi:DnaJ-domain-containing protein, partial [Aureobasidium melanogenum]|uniref:DnaJ-domain-containing protein n=1 Tax=Aureobasidium melanogenum (strain CBS 110374) TaxID=1043003 RepID=A0A074VXV6_AURM1
MGAGQSSTSGAQEAAPEAQKTGYYTLLGIERDATEDEIKKAYRRKALELHPDRNYGNVESATALFAEVQSAYEVLSDPQERAWYDSHESQILRGDDPTTGGSGGGEYEYGNVKMTSAEDLARMLRKFNSGVEFTDAPSGFFGFLRETFDQLAKEEEAAAHWEGLDLPDYPSFGHKDDSYDDVPKSFYAVWLSFSTRKSFAWCDKYRLSEAPDRRYRRLMEKENQRFREQGIREFNESVRALVAFVRKRDPRYIPNTQTEAERQKVLRDAAAAQAARARAANQVNTEDSAIPEWAQTITKDEHEGVIGESESEVEEVFECVACKKVFKSEKQWDAHEKSKKHQKAVQALRKKMQKENANLNLDSEPTSGDATPLDVEDYEPLPEDQYPMMEDEALPEDAYPIMDDDTAADMANLKLQDDLSESEDEEATHSVKTTEASENPTEETADTIDSSDDEYAPASQVKARLGQDPASMQDTVPNIEDPDSDATPAQAPKKGKAAQKRAKKAAAAAAASAEQEENKFKCATCDAMFPSKTRLHQHIKDFKHAALKSVTSAGGTKGKKGKR